MVSVRGALAEAAEQLRQVGVADPDREAAWLLAHLLQTSVGGLRLRSAEPLAEGALAAFADVVKRRGVGREPIQYILGTEEFMGLTFSVTPAVLIPRLDTAVLVETALAHLPVGAVRVADIGAGSGAIAVAMAAQRPDLSVVAVDISRDALAVARRNAVLNRVAERIDFRLGDLVAPLAGERFDAIVSNPPYIGTDEMESLMPEVRRWEPHVALTPGADALLIYRRLAVEAPPLLNDGGCLAVEVGAGQAAAVAGLFAAAGLVVSVYPDSAGIDRVVKGRR